MYLEFVKESRLHAPQVLLHFAHQEADSDCLLQHSVRKAGNVVLLGLNPFVGADHPVQPDRELTELFGRALDEGTRQDPVNVQPTLRVYLHTYVRNVLTLLDLPEIELLG